MSRIDNSDQSRPVAPASTQPKNTSSSAKGKAVSKINTQPPVSTNQVNVGYSERVLLDEFNAGNIAIVSLKANSSTKGTFTIAEHTVDGKIKIDPRLITDGKVAEYVENDPYLWVMNSIRNELKMSLTETLDKAKCREMVDSIFTSGIDFLKQIEQIKGVSVKTSEILFRIQNKIKNSEPLTQKDIRELTEITDTVGGLYDQVVKSEIEEGKVKSAADIFKEFLLQYADAGEERATIAGLLMTADNLNAFIKKTYLESKEAQTMVAEKMDLFNKAFAEKGKKFDLNKIPGNDAARYALYYQGLYNLLTSDYAPDEKMKANFTARMTLVEQEKLRYVFPNADGISPYLLAKKTNVGGTNGLYIIPGGEIADNLISGLNIKNGDLNDLILATGGVITAHNMFTGYSDSTIKIRDDGRDLKLTNPTFVFKVYLAEVLQTKPPINESKFMQVVTAEELRKLAEYKAVSDPKLGQTKANDGDIKALNELADMIESGKVVITDIYRNANVKGKEALCAKVNTALSVIRDFYEYTIFRNTELVVDGETQKKRELSEQGKLDKFSENVAFAGDIVTQLFRFPSTPDNKALDNASDEIVLAIKQKMFPGSQATAEYLSDARVDAKFIREFVKRYDGLLENPQILSLFGSDRENIKAPKEKLLEIATLMEKNGDTVSIHFERNVKDPAYRQLQVIMQNALPNFKLGSDSIHGGAKEVIGAGLLMDNMLHGMTAFPFALVLKGSLIKNNILKASDVDMNNDLVDGKVISAVALDFKATLDGVLAKVKKEELTPILISTGMSKTDADNIENYYKTLEDASKGSIKPFSFTYSNYDKADPKVLNALKVYTRTVLQLKDMLKEKTAVEPIVNIAVAVKKQNGWDKDTIEVKKGTGTSNTEAIFTDSEVPFEENVSITQATDKGMKQLVLFKFLMETQIQAQMQAGFAIQNKKIGEALTKGDPYAAKDFEDADKTFIKTRASFLGFRLPFVWMQSIVEGAGKGDPTAIAMLLVTGGFILHSTGTLIKMVGKTINRNVLRRSGTVSEAGVEVKSSKMTPEDIRPLNKDLSRIYEEGQNSLKKFGIKLLPEQVGLIETAETQSQAQQDKAKKLMGFVSTELPQMSSSSVIEYNLRTAAARTFSGIKLSPKILIDPVGIFELVSNGSIAAMEKLIGKPFSYVVNKTISLVTKRGTIDPKFTVNEASYQELIVKALNEPATNFKFSFTSDSAMNRKVSDVLSEGYKAVEHNKTGSWLLGKMQMGSPEPGKVTISLKGWQIARILASGENRSKVIKELGFKLTRREESIFLSNLEKSLSDIRFRGDAAQYIEKRLGLRVAFSEGEQTAEAMRAQVDKVLSEKASEVALKGEKIQLEEAKQFKALYEWASKNPLNEFGIDIGFKKYGYTLRLTGQEMCTLLKVQASPFILDWSMGFGPRSASAYSKSVDSIMQRNPWLEKVYLNRGYLTSQPIDTAAIDNKIYEKINELVQRAESEGKASKATVEQRIKTEMPLEYRVYEKVRDSLRYNELVVDEGGRKNWSAEDKRIFKEHGEIKAYHDIEARFFEQRIIEISKTMVPSEKGLPLPEGSPRVVDLGSHYVVNGDLYEKEAIEKALIEDPKATAGSHKKFMDNLDKASKDIHIKGQKLIRSRAMTDISSMITEPIMTRLVEAYPSSKLGTLFVANPLKHLVNMRFNEATAQAKIQEDLTAKEKAKAASEVKIEIKGLLPDAVAAKERETKGATEAEKVSPEKPATSVNENDIKVNVNENGVVKKMTLKEFKSNAIGGLKFGAGLTAAISLTDTLISKKDLSSGEVWIDVIKQTGEGAGIGAVWATLMPLAGKNKVRGGGVIGAGIAGILTAISNKDLLTSKNSYVRLEAGTDITWSLVKGGAAGAAFIAVEAPATTFTAPMGGWGGIAAFGLSMAAAAGVDGFMTKSGDFISKKTGFEEAYKVNVMKGYFEDLCGVKLEVMVQKPDSNMFDEKYFANMAYMMETNVEFTKAIKDAKIKEIKIDNINHLNGSLVGRLVSELSGLKDVKVEIKKTNEKKYSNFKRAGTATEYTITINDANGKKIKDVRMIQVNETFADPMWIEEGESKAIMAEKGITLDIRNNVTGDFYGTGKKTMEGLAQSLNNSSVSKLTLVDVFKLNENFRAIIVEIARSEGSGYSKELIVEVLDKKKGIVKITVKSSAGTKACLVELHGDTGFSRLMNSDGHLYGWKSQEDQYKAYLGIK